MYKPLIILLFFMSATIYGCNNRQGAKKESDQTEEKTQLKKDEVGITETYWKLVTLQGKSVPMHEDQKEAHIILKNKGNKVTGSGGCNVLNGTYELGDSNQISFSKMATTMMSCPDTETEQQFLKVFERVDTYQVKDDTLLLNNSDGKTLAKLISADRR